MEEKMFNEGYSIIQKLAYKFAYGNNSFKYEEYVSAGLEGLIKALKTYNEDNNTSFKTYATTCIRNAMCDSQKKQNRFDLQEDDNIILEDIKTLIDEIPDGNMEDIAKRGILKVNNQNERNAEMFMLHIGLTCEEPMNYKELSAKFNISSERVRQVCVNTRTAISNDKELKSLLYSFAG